MDRIPSRRISGLAFAVFAGALSVWALPPAAAAQRGGARGTIDVTPSALTLEVGETATLSAVVRDPDGEVSSVRVVFVSSDRRRLSADAETGRVDALAPGEYTVDVRSGIGRAEVAVTVLFPPLERIEVHQLPEVLYAGTLVRPEYRLYDVSGARRDDTLAFSSSDPDTVRIDPFGQIHPLRAGTATLTLTADGLQEAVRVRVEGNPARTLELEASPALVRTGDVVRFEATPRDEIRRVVEGLPVHFTLESHASRFDPGAPASARITPDGRFVAERPGLYTVAASVGTAAATLTLEVVPRGIGQDVELLDHALVSAHHTSDLWVWEGIDGRDYAVTGTWGGNGEAYFWDVTDPENILRVGEVRVDARTVNDVKVSEDGRIAVITREGASNRVNGVVILDVSDPSRVREIASFDEDLTGGVHNAFIDGNYLYALNNGTRYDVINIGEPANPFYVTSFELENPGHSIHDVWVEDGIAYSSNWEDGVVLVDVGNGVAGGAPDRPVQFSSYAGGQGLTHAAFPFRSQSTGRFYVIVGDESFPNGLDPEGPTVPAGYMHVVDFTDFGNPVEVARFEVPEAGSHNLWVEDDTLYAAFYNGGLRIVDLSGELMGDLYRQGREIASFLPKHREAFVPNESMVWGAQPHKGVIFLSDWNSGLWALRLEPKEED